MPEPQNPAPKVPHGLTPLVQMFPMHVGEPPESPARSGSTGKAKAGERNPNEPVREIGRAG